MTGYGYRCPDCGATFASSTELVDHALQAHVPQRPAVEQRRYGSRRYWIAGIITVLLVVLVATSWNDDVAPEQPDSIAHLIAQDLLAEGKIDSFQSRKPSNGWDVVYEFDDDDMTVSAATDGPVTEVIFEHFITGRGVKKAFERLIRARGFRKEDDRFYLVTAPPRKRSVVARIARDLERRGLITTAIPVEPAEGWDTEYRLDGLTDLRVRAVGQDKEMDWESPSPELDRAISRAATKYGYDQEAPSGTSSSDSSRS